MVLGYAMAAFTKPIFPLAHSVGWVFAARFIDRVGKGIRGAPRDALVGELAPPQMRGAAYGLRQALDSVGAFTGPLLAVGLMVLLANDIRTVMWFAVVPAFITVALLVFLVREPERAPADARAATPLSFADARRLPPRYWKIVLLGAVFTLARFSEAFLVLRAQDVGLAARLRAARDDRDERAVRGGRLSGRRRGRSRECPHDGVRRTGPADRRRRGAGGSGVAAVVFCGAALWGLHMAFTQGLLAKLVADTAPAELLGTGFGIFNLASGVALLLASVIAGALWSGFGPSATFLAGAAFAAVSQPSGWSSRRGATRSEAVDDRTAARVKHALPHPDAGIRREHRRARNLYLGPGGRAVARPYNDAWPCAQRCTAPT